MLSRVIFIVLYGPGLHLLKLQVIRVFWYIRRVLEVSRGDIRRFRRALGPTDFL